MNIAQVGSIILRLPSKESRMDFLVNLLLPQDKTSLDSLLVISFSTSILSNRCASHGCCKDWKIDRLSPIIFHDLWHLWLAVCWTLWKLENWPKLLTQLDCLIMDSFVGLSLRLAATTIYEVLHLSSVTSRLQSSIPTQNCLFIQTGKHKCTSLPLPWSTVL